MRRILALRPDHSQGQKTNMDKFSLKYAPLENTNNMATLRTLAQ